MLPIQFKVAHITFFRKRLCWFTTKSKTVKLRHYITPLIFSTWLALHSSSSLNIWGQTAFNVTLLDKSQFWYNMWENACRIFRHFKLGTSYAHFLTRRKNRLKILGVLYQEREEILTWIVYSYTCGKVTKYQRLTLCRFRVKFNAGVLYRKLSIRCEFRKNRYSEGHKFINGVKEFLPVIPTFPTWFGGS